MQSKRSTKLSYDPLFPLSFGAPLRSATEYTLLYNVYQMVPHKGGPRERVAKLPVLRYAAKVMYTLSPASKIQRFASEIEGSRSHNLQTTTINVLS